MVNIVLHHRFFKKFICIRQKKKWSIKLFSLNSSSWNYNNPFVYNICICSCGSSKCSKNVVTISLSSSSLLFHTFHSCHRSFRIRTCPCRSSLLTTCRSLFLFSAFVTVQSQGQLLNYPELWNLVFSSSKDIISGFFSFKVRSLKKSWENDISSSDSELEHKKKHTIQAYYILKIQVDVLYWYVMAVYESYSNFFSFFFF